MHLNIGAYKERTIPLGNPCHGLQGFPMELTPRVIICCIVRILEECRYMTHPYFLPTEDLISNEKEIEAAYVWSGIILWLYTNIYHPNTATYHALCLVQCSKKVS